MCVFLCFSLLHIPNLTHPPTQKEKKEGKKKKVKGKTENATTTQNSNVNLVELLLSTVQRGPCSLPFPTVTSSSASSVNVSEYRAVYSRRLIPYRRSGVCWKLWSCSSSSLDHGYSIFTSSILLGDETQCTIVVLPYNLLPSSSSFPWFDSRLPLFSSPSLSCFDNCFPLPFF